MDGRVLLGRGRCVLTEIKVIDWSGVRAAGPVDFPRAWEISRSVPPDKHPHPKCSFRQTAGALLCDCSVLYKHPEVTGVPVARPFLRIWEHELDDWPYAEWRGWFFECRRPDGTVVATHPAVGLDGSQWMAYRHALRHLREGGCPVEAGGAP